MSITDKEKDIITKAGVDFVRDSLREGDDMVTALFLMHEKIKIAQIALICIMAQIRKPEHVATFYADMVEMGNSGLNEVMKHPEFLQNAPLAFGLKDHESSVEEIVKILKEINSFKRKTT